MGKKSHPVIHIKGEKLIFQLKTVQKAFVKQFVAKLFTPWTCMDCMVCGLMSDPDINEEKEKTISSDYK